VMAPKKNLANEGQLRQPPALEIDFDLSCLTSERSPSNQSPALPTESYFSIGAF
jgi:hypothetical protein